jgi:hypothetical protein
LTFLGFIGDSECTLESNFAGFNAVNRGYPGRCGR